MPPVLVLSMGLIVMGSMMFRIMVFWENDCAGFDWTFPAHCVACGDCLHDEDDYQYAVASWDGVVCGWCNDAPNGRSRAAEYARWLLMGRDMRLAA